MAGAFHRTFLKDSTADKLRDLVARHKDLQGSIDLAIAELEKGRPAVAANILRHARTSDRRKRR